MILFTGGSGLLGKEMQELYPQGLFPTHKEFDVADFDKMFHHIYDNNLIVDTIVHAAAYTNTTQCETIRTSKVECITTNIIGTANIVKICMAFNIRLIYISTDYVYAGNKKYSKETDAVNPINNYAFSKLGGECSVHFLADFVIVRTSFCKNEYPYDRAFDDQYISRIPVNKFAKKLERIIDNKHIQGIINVGGKRKTVYELAKKISPEKEIIPIKRNDIQNYKLPKDTSLNTERFKRL